MCDYKKAVISGVISYAILFLIISALMGTPLWTSGYINYINLIIVFIVVFLVAQKYYFRGIKPKANEGLVLGIIMAIVAFLIEIPVMAYGFAADMGMNWFTQWNILTGYILTIIAALLASKTLGKTTRKKK
ncbi:MAG: hypothetical protein ACE5J7_02360 [Candidatus Aenigmatarchaeota archaeon]